MSGRQCRQRELVYVPVLGGYDIQCRNCGETFRNMTLHPLHAKKLVS